ncbi:MAG: hypothetical protein Q8R15_05285 [Candidatus Micrarchaeota archaeon]|nr:hypothetical protein [Candidatus Micrarchaeota archaeon]
MPFVKKRRGASEWSSIYMLVVVVIAAILLFTLIKPTLKAAGQAATANTQEARSIAAIGSYFLMRRKI